MPNSEPLFRGVGVALVSLFNDDGGLDVPATVAHANRVVARGVRGVLVAGTTGEFWALSEPERLELIRTARAEIPAHVPVVAGTGANDAATAVRLTAGAVEAGADGVLVLAPPNSTDLVGYFTAVAGAAGGKPVLGYHMPLLSSPGLPVEELNNLPIQGIKDSAVEPRHHHTPIGFISSTDWRGSRADAASCAPSKSWIATKMSPRSARPRNTPTAIWNSGIALEW
jgi:dihydrodipicolinate synthase/N-acetylneuraminate lyase